MRKENYRDAVTRFTKAHNFPGGAYILATYNPEESENISIGAHGEDMDLFVMSAGVLERLLKHLDDGRALKLREGIKKVIIADEERRFQGREAKL